METKIEINPDELPLIKDKIMKCKVIALDLLDKHPLLNPKYMSASDKGKLIKKIRELLDTLSTEEITLKFNDICNERLLSPTVDYTNYPIYVDRRFPDQQNKIDEEEPELEKLKESIKVNNIVS